MIELLSKDTGQCCFGLPNNLGLNENDSVELQLQNGAVTIGFRVVPPTGGEVTFEGSFDGTNWEAISMRSIDTDTFTSSTSNTQNFIGSIAGVQKFRFRTSTAGSANGTVIGKRQSSTSVIEAIEFGNPPHRFGYPTVKKDASYTTAQTATDIWTPASGKTIVLTDISIICGGTTDAVVTIFDETNSSGNIIFKGTIDVSNNRQFVYTHSYGQGIVLSSANNDIKITTSANMTIDIVLAGYEF